LSIYKYLSVFLDAFFFGSAVKKKFKDKISEFQVSLANSEKKMFSKKVVLSSYLCHLQTLRQNIQQEYREVVERRVFTGLN